MATLCSKSSHTQLLLHSCVFDSTTKIFVIKCSRKDGHGFEPSCNNCNAYNTHNVGQQQGFEYGGSQLNLGFTSFPYDNKNLHIQLTIYCCNSLVNVRINWFHVLLLQTASLFQFFE
jgi:hypothetical protein